MQIIESPEEQNNPELSDDRLYVFGLFQSTCARVVTRHLVNNNEMNADPFPVWQDLFECHDGSEKT